MNMHRSSLVFLTTLALVLAGALGASSAGAASKSCAPKHVKTMWHQYGVKVYYDKNGSVFACADKYGKRRHLEKADFGETGSLSMFHTNGRYLYYTRLFQGPTQNLGSIGRLLDLKTGASTKFLGPRDIDYSKTPECAPVEIDCGRNAQGAAIGPARSFVIGYWMTFSNPQGDRIGEEFWVERHCFAPGLINPTVTLLDKVTSIADLASIKAQGVNTATWTNGGVKKSAPFC